MFALIKATEILIRRQAKYAYRRQWAKDNPEKAKKWRRENPDKNRASSMASYYRNRPARLTNAHRWYRQNSDKVKAIGLAWQRKNRGRYRAYQAKWRAAHREELKEYFSYAARLKREPNYKHNLRQAEYRRRALEKSSVGSFTAKEWIAVCDRQKHRCAMCNKRKRLTVDHVIPLSKGGSNFITNIQGLCHSCNSKKGAKLCAR
jgi:5-methylcytosine-specific restriction endonuclease McrA